MNGSKSILALIVSAILVPLLAKQGLTLTADQQLEFVAFGVAAVGVVMRFFTSGPALADIRAWFAAMAVRKTVDVNELTDAVVVELKRRNAAAVAKARAALAANKAPAPEAPVLKESVQK